MFAAIPFLLIAGATLGDWVSGEAGKLSDSLPWSTHPATIPGQGGGTDSPALPRWVLPTALIVVGGLLLYKKGAKLLKV